MRTNFFIQIRLTGEQCNDLAMIVARGLAVMKPSAISMLLCLWIGLASSSAYSSPFDKGRGQLSLTLSNGSLLNQDYIVLGAGYGYFLTNGLNVSVDLNMWLDGDPKVYQVTPEIGYVFYMVPKFKPYAGVFYRRNYIEGFDDINAYGYRAGVYFLAGANTYIGYGITHSQLSNCNENIYLSCGDTYADLSVVISLH